MALAYYEATEPEAAPLYRPDSTLSPDESAHLRTYRKFTMLARTAAFCAPLLLAFVLYWTQ
ncbi:hypothetical protein [uncultured Methylovirgula sp.]|uniref:hypothetical protein n=1 Tax=uncultured Methylovirgula sp. TaxID=1285960 RepID=UPI00261A77BE|nr:hypothetical protein [uncultured Methylovirgula sp.]